VANMADLLPPSRLNGIDRLTSPTRPVAATQVYCGRRSFDTVSLARPPK